MTALASCRIKIDRAIKHFNDLNAEIEAFKATKPYEIVIDEDSEPAIKIYKIAKLTPFPEEWSAYIGDILHNLRSALDSLALALVRRNEPSPVSEKIMQETHFPINWDRDNFPSKDAKTFFERVGPAAEKYIRRLQPYRGGCGDTLWRLHRMNIIDKHRAIIPVGLGLAKINLTKAGYATRDSRDPGTVRTASWVVYNVGGRTIYPLKEGDEIWRSAFQEPHFDAQAHFVLEIALDTRDVADGAPAMEALSKFINFVQRLVMIFEKRFF